MQWVNRTLDRVYAEAATGPGRAAMSTPDWKATRWALRTGENKLTDDKRALVNQIARTNRRMVASQERCKSCGRRFRSLAFMTLCDGCGIGWRHVGFG